MFTKTNKQRKSVIITAILALIVLLAGLFCVFKDDKKTVSASADTGFYFEEGMALNVEPDNMHCRFIVNITLDMYGNLNQITDHDKFLWIDKYTPNDYYLRITRSDGFYVDYHIDPAHSKMSAEQLVLSEDYTVETKAYLEFPFGTDFSTEYTYECSYRKYGTTYVNQYTGQEMDYYEQGVTSVVEGLGLVDKTSNTVTRSVSYVASKVLEYDYDSYNDEQIEWFQYLAGSIPSDGKIPVILNYQYCEDYGYIVEKTKIFEVDSRFMYAGNAVFLEALKSMGYTDITKFNVSYADDFGGRIILQADDYTYEYQTSEERGVLTIVYRPFSYQNFALRLQDNDTDDGINAFAYIYATGDDVEYTGIEWEAGETATLTFDYGKIGAWMEASYTNWLFDLTFDDIVIDNTRAPHIEVVAGKDELTVSFDPAYEEELKNLSITILAEIEPDHEMTLNVTYQHLAFDGKTITDQWITEEYTVMFREYYFLLRWGEFQKSDYYKTVLSALEVDELGDEKYLIPKNVDGTTIEEGFSPSIQDDGTVSYLIPPVREIVVEYDEWVLFAITDALSGNVHFKSSYNRNSLFYNVEDLKLTPPDGYRLAALESDDSLVDVEFAEDDAENAEVKLKVNSGQKLIIPITATFSDKWYLDILYLKPYKNTPFAVKTTETFEVGVNDYEDIENMKKADILALLDRNSMVVANIADADAVAHAELTSSSTYTCTVTYGVASWKQVDYEGKGNELQIPLTSYADWCNTFGKDWTIMYLNRYDGERYFEYTNEVEREDLYGFFSVAVFEEKVSNLNYYFANSGGDGSAIMFEEEEVKGDAVYRFFDNFRGKGVITSLVGHVGMAFCELVNDNNATYTSVHFYLDGTTKQGGIDRNNGGDNDSAFENATEDFFDKMGDFFDDFSNGFKKFGKKILKYGAIGLGCIVGGGIVVGVGVKLGKKFYRWATTDKPKPQATEQPKKQPAKKKKKKRSGSNKRKRK